MPGKQRQEGVQDSDYSRKGNWLCTDGAIETSSGPVNIMPLRLLRRRGCDLLSGAAS